MFNGKLTSFFRQWFCGKSTRRPGCKKSAALCVEVLEERAVPAQIWAIFNLNDAGAGSLRDILTGLDRQNGQAIADGDTVYYDGRTGPRNAKPDVINLFSPITCSKSVTIRCVYGSFTSLVPDRPDPSVVPIPLIIDGSLGGNRQVARHQALILNNAGTAVNTAIRNISFRGCSGPNGARSMASARLSWKTAISLTVRREVAGRSGSAER